MSEVWRNVCGRLGDVLLGWLLWLPRDAALVLLALILVLLALGLRRLVTDPVLLRRIRQDQRRLKELIRQARVDRDASAQARYRRTAGAVALLRLRQELRALAVSLIPLALVVTWAAERIHLVPPAANEPVEFSVWLPSSAVGEVAHLVPEQELQSPGGWVRTVEQARRGARPRGTAQWILPAPASDRPYRLTVRFRGQSWDHPVLIGQRRYGPTRKIHGADVETEIRLREYRPFGIGGGGRLPPWLLAYLALAASAYPLLKWLLGGESGRDGGSPGSVQVPRTTSSP